MLVRHRLSRIYHRRRFFDYPIRLDVRTIVQPRRRSGRCAAGLSYLAARRRSRVAPSAISRTSSSTASGGSSTRRSSSRTPRRSGACPAPGSARRGARSGSRGCRSRAPSLHAVQSRGGPRAEGPRTTSLIERFLYPKLGPGQLWEEVAAAGARAGGGSIAMNRRVERIALSASGRVVAVDVRVGDSDAVETMRCDYVDLDDAGEGPRRLHRSAGRPTDVREIARAARRTATSSSSA